MCPECREPLIVVELEGAEVDHCLTCHGTWLDAGELELLMERAGLRPQRWAEALSAAGAGKRGARRCPRCRRKMRLISVGSAPPVVLDRCPAGCGLWLDAGELRTIAHEFAAGERAAVSGFLGDMLRHGLGT
jgi:Zn-finger nucleic acid-binding protein